MSGRHDAASFDVTVSQHDAAGFDVTVGRPGGGR
jgi:hypothetical protein